MNSYSSHYLNAYSHHHLRPPPGPRRCTHPSCSFSGSQHAVEIHMMDRHLIYPPNYSKRKKHDDWDADPSLKGKQIPIQGTNLILNTAEDIQAWIAERRKRYPTANRIADKKEKLQQAISRGQLHLDDNPRFPKRPRLDNDSYRRGRGGRRPHGRGSGFQHPRTTIPAPLPPKPSTVSYSSSSSSSDSDDDGPPDTLSSKAPDPSEVHLPEEPPKSEPQGLPVKKPIVRQPRPPISNPFASKPCLLRNLLLPEIRNTVSNLSQAIRFLVDNDFLDNVELKPGDVGEQKIQIVHPEQEDQQST